MPYHEYTLFLSPGTNQATEQKKLYMKELSWVNLFSMFKSTVCLDAICHLPFLNCLA